MDFFEAEDPIKQRLIQAVEAINGRAYSSADNEIDIRTDVPIAFVVYNGFGIENTRSDLAKAKLVQNWMVVLVGRVANDVEGTKTRGQVGPAITQAMASLLGWKPSDNTTPLAMQEAPEPYYDENGFGYFPLIFNTNFVVTADQ